MQWCRIVVERRPSYGLVEDQHVELISAAPFERHERTGARHAVSDVKLLPPVMPKNFYAAGMNFRTHIEWAAQAHGTPPRISEQADIGYCSPNALVGSGAGHRHRRLPGPVEMKASSLQLLGGKPKDLLEAEALSCIARHTTSADDVSERTWQRSAHAPGGVPRMLDTFKPMGRIASGLDPMAQMIMIWINGKVVSEYRTRDAIFSLQHYLARMTRYVMFFLAM